MRGFYHRYLSRAEIFTHRKRALAKKEVEEIVVSLFCETSIVRLFAYESSYHRNLRLYWKHRRESFVGSRLDHRAFWHRQFYPAR